MLESTATPYASFILNQCHNIPLAMVAQQFGLKGPSFSIGGACASGNHAIFLTYQVIKAGLVDSTLVVGFGFALITLCVGGFECRLYKRDKPPIARTTARRRQLPFSGDRRGLSCRGRGRRLHLRGGTHDARWPVKVVIGGYYRRRSPDAHAHLQYRHLHARGDQRG